MNGAFSRKRDDSVDGDGRYPFAFAPVPRWIFAARRDRLLSESDKQLLELLFYLARGTALKAGQETPSVTLDVLLGYLATRSFRRASEHRTALETLRKRIERAEDRGLLSYRVMGSADGSYLYIFTLPRAAPITSVPRPSPSGARRPTGAVAQTGPATDVLTADVQAASDPSRAPIMHSRPISDVLCPTPSEPASAVAERDSAAAPDDLCPSPRDVRDDTNKRMEGTDRLEASGYRRRDDAQAVGRRTEEADLLAELEALVATSPRTPTPALCRYPGHRWSDYVRDEHSFCCGVCHPSIVSRRGSSLGADRGSDSGSA